MKERKITDKMLKAFLQGQLHPLLEAVKKIVLKNFVKICLLYLPKSAN